MIWHGIYKQLVQVFIENISNQLFFAIFVNAEKICSVWKSCLNIFQQLFFGLIFGVLFGKGAVWALNRLQFQIAEGKTIFVFAAAVLAYAVPVLLGGNGYLSVYLCGIIMGNSSMPHPAQPMNHP